jgi:hypothetical protein
MHTLSTFDEIAWNILNLDLIFCMDGENIEIHLWKKKKKKKIRVQELIFSDFFEDKTFKNREI